MIFYIENIENVEIYKTKWEYRERCWRTKEKINDEEPLQIFLDDMISVDHAGDIMTNLILKIMKQCWSHYDGWRY